MWIISAAWRLFACILLLLLPIILQSTATVDGQDDNCDEFMYASEEDINQCTKAIEEDFWRNIFQPTITGQTACLEYILTKKSEWQNKRLNVAVIGMSGAGKSSLCNAFRNLKSHDEGAAPVGVDARTTTMKVYPLNKNLLFWDLPGIGTKNFTRDIYLQAINVAKFDSFIILTASRFYEDVAWLGREINKLNKSVYFVRNKIGMDVRADKHERGEAHNPDQVLDGIRSNMLNELKESDIKAPIFLVDTHNKERYDFPQLEAAVVKDLSLFKGKAMIFALHAFSASMIRAKVADLRTGVWPAAILATGTGAVIPIPGATLAVDLLMFRHITDFYFKRVGLNEESLALRASIQSVNVQRLYKIVWKYFPNSGPLLQDSDIIQLLGASAVIAEDNKEDLAVMGLEKVSVLMKLARGKIHDFANKVQRTLPKLAESMSKFARQASPAVPFVGQVFNVFATHHALDSLLDKIEMVALEVAAVRPDDLRHEWHHEL